VSRKRFTATYLGLIAGLLIASPGCAGDFTNNTEVKVFIEDMVKQHGFQRERLVALFNQAKKRNDILEAIARPAEKTKPWYEYRKIFLTPERIEGGVDFWKDNAARLKRAAQHFGVDPAVVVAIIGVETRYGKHTGSYRVIDSLSTLAFAYPPRSKFFRSELEQFLMLTREEDVDPTQVKGSYAGAMGYGQFIPSSYRNYAVDFGGDGKRNLWNDLDDIIGSVANYFHRHGWKAGEPVAARVSAGSPLEHFSVSDDLKPGETTAGDFMASGTSTSPRLAANIPVALLELQQADGPEFWLTCNNFYVITRYNRSPLYAMAVYQLSEAIRDAYHEDTD
jgi:membrane-bound lytic murein transglycosylase B